MYELFFKKFNEKVPLLPEEVEIIKKYLTPKKLGQKQYLLQEGDILLLSNKASFMSGSQVVVDGGFLSV